MAVTVKRKSVVFSPDSRRVIPRFFMPGDPKRAWSIIEKVLALSESDTRQALDCVLRLFALYRTKTISKINPKNSKKIQKKQNLR